jgi:hypothetical protein
VKLQGAAPTTLVAPETRKQLLKVKQGDRFLNG